MWTAGNLTPGQGHLAMNFLMDRSVENWAREFARMKVESGDCETGAPIEATGALTGRFSWRCTHGTMQGQLLLAPTDPPTIQALRFTFITPAMR